MRQREFLLPGEAGFYFTERTCPAISVGKSVNVEREVYEPKLKDYVKIKVAAGLKTN